MIAVTTVILAIVSLTQAYQKTVEKNSEYKDESRKIQSEQLIKYNTLLVRYNLLLQKYKTLKNNYKKLYMAYKKTRLKKDDKVDG